MPNWQPNWNNVRWNWGASAAAADALRRCATQLETTTDARVAAAAIATLEWRGGYRDQFDGDFRLDRVNFQSLAAEMRRMAGLIEEMADRARAEQAHRERERERWHRERAEEERRRREEEEERRRRNRRP